MSEGRPIQRGMLVRVRNAWGEWHIKRALTSVVAGHDFPVVWVCRPEAWDEAIRDEESEVRIPWPAEDVESESA
jgi:hypothetical protein